MNKLNIAILTSGLSTLMFVPQILAQTTNFVDIKGDRNLTPLGIRALDSVTSPTSPIAAKLVLVIKRIETNTTSRQILREGDELLVTVYGTPRASASFRLEGLNRNRAITMTEVERGIYEGRYTIRRNDRQVNSRLTVTLNKQGASPVTRRFNQAIVINSTANGNNNNSPVAADLVIEKIETNTTSRQILREGDELLVTVYGTPRANASFRLEGLNRNRAITMTEVERGIYEGRYTIRRNDGQINSKLTVTLSQQDANSVTREFNQAIAVNSNANGNNNNSPVASDLVIQRIETNTTPRQTLIQGDELLVTAYGTPGSSASFRLEGLNRNTSVTMTEVERGIYEGRYTIRRNDGQINSKLTVTLSQQDANSVTREFNQVIAVNSNANGNNNGNNNNGNNNNYQSLKPEITNFNNNDAISLPVNLVGQTLPNANVQVTVEVLRSVIGIIDISQTIFNNTVSADGQGRFIVSLPSSNLVSGTRYRVRLNATQNNQSQSNEIFLRQN